MSSHLSHHPQEVLLAQVSVHEHNGCLKPYSFHFTFDQNWAMVSCLPCNNVLQQTQYVDLTLAQCSCCSTVFDDVPTSGQHMFKFMFKYRYDLGLAGGNIRENSSKCTTQNTKKTVLHILIHVYTIAQSMHSLQFSFKTF